VTVITENLWTEISVKCSERRQPTRQRTDSLFIPTHSAPAVLHPDNCCWFWNVGGMFFFKLRTDLDENMLRSDSHCDTEVTSNFCKILGSCAGFRTCRTRRCWTILMKCRLLFFFFFKGGQFDGHRLLLYSLPHWMYCWLFSRWRDVLLWLIKFCRSLSVSLSLSLSLSLSSVEPI